METGDDGIEHIVYEQQVSMGLADASVVGNSNIIPTAGETINIGHNNSYIRMGHLYLHDEMTLYAKWRPHNAADYKVVVWKQDVTDSKNAADDQKTYDYYTYKLMEDYPSSTIVLDSEDYQALGYENLKNSADASIQADLQRVTFNTEKISVIQPQTFYQCSQLSEISLPSSVTELGDYAFAECSSLSYLELPTTVTTFGKDVFLNDSALTLGVYFDSAAYHYAIENGIDYRLLDGVLLGDTNGDGIININDVTILQHHIAEFTLLEGIWLHAAEINRSGSVDISDATDIQRYLAEFNDPYSIGEVMTH